MGPSRGRGALIATILALILSCVCCWVLYLDTDSSLVCVGWCGVWLVLSVVEDLVTDLICCLVSTCWSGVVCGVWSGILPGGWYLIWCLVIKSNLVSGIWLGGWS